MRRTALALVMTVVVLAGAVTAQQTRQQDIDLQAAIRTETVDGDLNAAIKQYQTIVDRFKTDRAVVATALVRMADCYQKLGDAQARTIYERVVREYADQKEVVATAQARLGNSPAVAGRVVRELWLGDRSGLQASLAPDGRAVVTHAIRDISTGRVTKVLPDYNPARGGWEEWPVLSPDSTQIAYARCCDEEGAYEVRLSPAELGAKPRVLLHNPEFAYYVLEDWSRDGKSILSIMITAGKNAQLAWISASDGTVTTLRSLEWRRATSAHLSPDGRFIAYDVLARQDSPDREIRVIDSDAGHESVVVSASGDNSSPIWTRDGSRIVFLSTRSGAEGLWSIPVRDGKADGPAELVRPSMGGIRPLGFSNTGSFLYVQKLGNQNVFVQTLDPVTGKAEGDASKIVDTYVGANTNPSWSPDGTSIAYISRRAEATDQTSPATLVVRSLETGKETTIPTTFTGPGQPRWFADGQTILQVARNNQNTTCFYTVDLKTRAVRELVNTGSGLPPGNALSPDGKTVYVRHPQKPDTIAGFDLATGRLMDTNGPAVEGPFLSVAVSPDGDRLAYPARGASDLRLYVTKTDGSDAHDLFAGYPQKGYVTALAWTPDNQSIYFVLSDGANVSGHGSQLWRVSANGGAPEYTGLSASTMGAIALNRDGTRLVFGGGELVTSEYWALDNLERAWRRSNK